ncbi:Protein involved in catabolism of external DNA [Treponema sp. JC4]|uniref:23S rRNA (adenine(2030)-N(6))-methyltransferase RlmJ n=1 Tax=Treponema sp. JC4 TaxID=1124982 RepID=UPI00025B072D|nr:23S rRNA (adenine(2030)-N(6))-methyltransferase RlmJ [Treponema sp. JC4]EID85248.1 Protein involved in catabolism of external DNA [Treponema sp. JC4]
MLSYQHAFHAGNHADILKHLTLFFVLSSLNKKEKPYTYFDTHSASGLYDLLDNRSQKTGEAGQGISRLISSKLMISGSHSLLSDYLSLIDRYYSKNFYPGSPEIARVLSRRQDFLVLSELHPQEIENLRRNMLKTPFCQAACSQIQIHARNGFEMLKALTPPKTKRGAVLIDPSYEEISDYIDCAKTISAVNKKWTNGIIMLWYPLLAHRESEINQMLDDIQASARSVNPNIEICDLRLQVAAKDSHKEMSLKEYEESEKNPPRLYGSGMLVLNAPWHLEEEVNSCLEAISSCLSSTSQ